MMLGATLLGMSVYEPSPSGPPVPPYAGAARLCASLTRYHYAATAMLALGEW
jgi:hypothetical protein